VSMNTSKPCSRARLAVLVLGKPAVPFFARLKVGKVERFEDPAVNKQSGRTGRPSRRGVDEVPPRFSEIAETRSTKAPAPFTSMRAAL
jgi:hypothetical protein